MSNPGNVYGNLTIEDLKRDDYVSSIRNKLLAEAYYLTGDIEKYGTGYVRIRRILKDSPEVLFDLNLVGDFFRVELTTISGKVKNLPVNLPVNLPETQQDIIKNILTNSKVTYDELAGITGKTRETIRVHINKLKKMGVIKRFGSDKGGHWQVTPQENK